jgi:23S rRNA (cytosine1962-C5)-methyltransferase
MSTQKTKHPRVQFRKGAHKRFKAGHPWAFSNEIEMDAAAKALPAGSVVTLTDAGGELLGTAHFNPHTLIAARLLTPEPDAAIDEAFVRERLRSAAALRDRLFAKPYYRLVHAEADGLPGLVIDRFGDVAVIQPNTAGMDQLLPAIAAALKALGIHTLVMRGDSAARGREGLKPEARALEGALDGPIAVEENGATFYADLLSGQKTGWFFDQRDNRAFMAGLSANLTVLDLYTHTGGFGIAAARAGAKHVTLVDSSAPALAFAEKAAESAGVKARCTFARQDVFPFLEASQSRRWDVVIADPPAFVKSRKDLKAGLQGYRKLARLCAGVTAPGGFLFIASCSHNAPVAEFTAAVARGVADAGREARILRTSGAGADHPVHPALPETAYLKAVVLHLS